MSYKVSLILKEGTRKNKVINSNISLLLIKIKKLIINVYQ